MSHFPNLLGVEVKHLLALGLLRTDTKVIELPHHHISRAFRRGCDTSSLLLISDELRMHLRWVLRGHCSGLSFSFVHMETACSNS
jgi:hypothetical protein